VTALRAPSSDEAPIGVAELDRRLRMLLERRTEVHPLPRAVHLDDEAVRVLQSVGVAPAFRAISRPGRGLRLLDADLRTMAEFARGPGQYGHPQASFFDQPDLERVLRAELCRRPEAVLRPGVEELVRRDIAAARPIVRWIERRWPNPHIRSAGAIIDEFAIRIWDEMDFCKEAANAEEIRANFAGNRRVAVPRVLAELVTTRVLVLEFMVGERIDALGPGSPDPRGIISAVMELYIQMMLVDGLFHADPHPGNLLVAPDGTLVLLNSTAAFIGVGASDQTFSGNSKFLYARNALLGTISVFAVESDGSLTRLQDIVAVPPGGAAIGIAGK